MMYLVLLIGNARSLDFPTRIMVSREMNSELGTRNYTELGTPANS